MKIQYDKVNLKQPYTSSIGGIGLKIKMAVFGRQETINRIGKLLPETVEALSFVYSKTEETRELFDTVYHCDIYLFTEYLSFLFVKETIEKNRLPAIQVEQDPYAIITALYRLENNFEIPPKKIALDVFDGENFDELRQEAGLEKGNIRYFVHDPDDVPDMESLLSFYTTLWEKKKADHILTSAEEVAEELTARGIAASTIPIPELNLRRAVTEAIDLVTLNTAENNHIVTGYVTIKHTEHGTMAENGQKETWEELNRILQRLAARTGAFSIRTVDDRFIIFGTEKLLKHLREHYRSFPLLHEMKNTIRFPVNLAFGLGLTADESAKNAEIALERCMQNEQSICYIVNERQELIGPVGVKKEIDASKLYQTLIHDAKLNNEISYNFIDFITERNNEPFSTNDIAQFYNVTKRSAERTVNKLLQGNVIKVAGEERPYKKGRPRKLFTLNQ